MFNRRIKPTDFTVMHNKFNKKVEEETIILNKEMALKELENERKAKRIYQYNLKGDLIKIWAGARQCYDEKGYSVQTISNVCNGVYNGGSKYKGYIWSYEELNKEEVLEMAKPKKLNKVQKKVYQYDLEGNLIKIWDSAVECDKEEGFSLYCISRACNNRYYDSNIYNNYMWSFEPLENLEKNKN